MKLAKMAVLAGGVLLRKGSTMRARMMIGWVAMMCVLVLPANAGGKGDLQRYFSDAASRVKAAESPSAKRAILNESFDTMTRALEMVQGSRTMSKDDAVGLERFKATLREKQDELAGVNGFARVTDDQLNTFSDYVVQDMEQADQVVTISLVALLLIIILVVILL